MRFSNKWVDNLPCYIDNEEVSNNDLQYSSASCCMVTAWLAGDFSCTSYLKFSLHTIFRFT